MQDDFKAPLQSFGIEREDAERLSVIVDHLSRRLQTFAIYCTVKAADAGLLGLRPSLVRFSFLCRAADFRHKRIRLLRLVRGDVADMNIGAADS